MCTCGIYFLETTSYDLIFAEYVQMRWKDAFEETLKIKLYEVGIDAFMTQDSGGIIKSKPNQWTNASLRSTFFRTG